MIQRLAQARIKAGLTQRLIDRCEHKHDGHRSPSVSESVWKNGRILEATVPSRTWAVSVQNMAAHSSCWSWNYGQMVIVGVSKVKTTCIVRKVKWSGCVLYSCTCSLQTNHLLYWTVFYICFPAWNTINNVKLTSGEDEEAIIPSLGYETIVPSVETDLENPNRICCSHYWCQIRNAVIFGIIWNISVHVNILGEPRTLMITPTNIYCWYYNVLHCKLKLTRLFFERAGSTKPRDLFQTVVMTLLCRAKSS